MKDYRNISHVVVLGIIFCLVPVIGFMLVSLWPQRVLVSWLLFALFTIAVLTKLTLLLIKTRTIAKVRMAEEALRPGRLYAHERLVEHEGQHNDDWPVQPQVKSEPYAQRPYVYTPGYQPSDVHEADSTSYSRGLPPLSTNSYDWREEK